MMKREENYYAENNRYKIIRNKIIRYKIISIKSKEM